jgi:hypothetical protein
MEGDSQWRSLEVYTQHFGEFFNHSYALHVRSMRIEKNGDVKMITPVCNGNQGETA